jgi:penicillin-binding protein 1A
VSPSKIYADPPVFNVPNCNDPDPKNCKISNSEGESIGPTSIKEAMAHSLNTVYAPLGRDVGFTNVGNMAKKLGLDDAWYSSDVHRNSGVYSLGVIDTSPLEMASAYGVFANRGVRQTATPIVKIVDPAGKAVEDNSERQGKRVISEAVADNVTDALEGVITHGTAAGSANIGRQAAGKTGTTENFGNAWFVGYTPTLSTAVWMGYSDSNARINYKGNRNVYGATVSAPAWATFMKAALKDVPQTKFEDPAPITKVNTNALNNSITTLPAITPAQVRTPKAVPSGGFDQTNGGVAVSTTAPKVQPVDPVTP